LKKKLEESKLPETASINLAAEEEKVENKDGKVKREKEEAQR
jgi:hypothetical protein